MERIRDGENKGTAGDNAGKVLGGEQTLYRAPYIPVLVLSSPESGKYRM